MLWQKHNAASEWYHSDQNIDSWLKERQDMLGLYYRVLHLAPFEDEETQDADILQEFCEILIDYVSAGHFEIFEQISKASESQPSEQFGLDKQLMIDILRTTQYAMQFSNKYANNPSQLNDLNSDLSELGEALAKRMDLEDKLIRSYLKATFHLKEIQKSNQIS